MVTYLIIILQVLLHLLPDLSPYATTQYVDQEILGVIDAAPGALDTLNELAAAIGDDANFATTVTNNLAAKANTASPALTGTPTAPTPSATDNSTKIATTAFVQNLAGAQEIGDLSDVDIGTLQDGQVLAYSISAQKFINQNQSGTGGGTGGTVNFIVDGGTATTVSNDIIIFLDGGSIMAARIQLRRDTSSNWSTTNPTLNSGELGVETNTSKIKLGDGSTAWNSLDYVVYPLSFSDLLNTPTTIAGYGITDAFDGAFSSLVELLQRCQDMALQMLCL